MDNLKTKLKDCRENKKLTKSQLARIIGVSPSYITMLENGEKRNPSLEILSKISVALDIPLDELMLVAGNSNFDHEYRSQLKGKTKEPLGFNAVAYFLDMANNPRRYLLKNTFHVDVDSLTNSQIDEIVNALKFTIKLKLEEFENNKKNK